MNLPVIDHVWDAIDRRLKMRNKLLLGFLTVLAIVFLINANSILTVRRVMKEVKSIEGVASPGALTAKEMELAVVQVQQSLTDVSATGGDGGFRDAEEWAEKYRNLSQELKGIYRDDPEILKILSETDQQFESFYYRGEEMARAYLEGGREAGNELMEGFDVVADGLQEALIGLVDGNVSSLSQSLGDISTSLSRSNTFNVGTTMFAVILGVSLALMIGVKIVKPMRRVTDTVGKIAEGDLTRRVEHEDYGDELGDLARSFNSFVEKFHGVISEVAALTTHLASSSHELSASAEQIAQGSEEQSRQTEQVSAAVEEMSATVVEVAGNSQKAAQAAQTAHSTAEKGGDIVARAIEGMNSISASVVESANVIRALGKSSDQIGEIVAVIDDIADQTNLLALNAAIEAARAGELGRGFAVVADEVRKLAERTSKATKEIAGMIRSIQDDTGRAVASMEEGTQKVEGGVELVNEVDEALNEIIAAVRTVLDMSQQIAAATEQQSAAAQQVATNVEGISSVSKESASSAQQSAEASLDLNKMAYNLENIVSRFKLMKNGSTSEEKHKMGVEA